MNAQQYLDIVIRPTLAEMGPRYNTYSARALLLGTAAIESDLGLYNKQVNGPAVSPFQLEPPTIIDIAKHWDAFPAMAGTIRKLSNLYQISGTSIVHECEVNHRLACLMARGKYAMDPQKLPAHDDMEALYNYYKRVYNTDGGKSNFIKWCAAWKKHKLDEVEV